MHAGQTACGLGRGMQAEHSWQAACPPCPCLSTHQAVQGDEDDIQAVQAVLQRRAWRHRLTGRPHKLLEHWWVGGGRIAGTEVCVWGGG